MNYPKCNPSAIPSEADLGYGVAFLEGCVLGAGDWFGRVFGGFSKQQLQVLAAGSVGIVLSVPGQTMGVGVFTASLGESLQLTALLLSAAYLVGTFASSLFLPLAGRLLDRHGERMVAGWVFPIFALVLAGFAFLPDLAAWSRNQLPGLELVVSFVGASLGFLALRHLGQGYMTITARSMIGKWFTHNRGRAFAISGAFVACGFGAAPTVLYQLHQSLGFKGSYLVMAAVIAVGTLLVMYYRPRPEEAAQSPQESGEPAAAHRGAEVPAFKSHARFWIFNLGTAYHALIITAVTFFIATIAERDGLPAAQAFALFLPGAFLATFVNVAASSLSDHWRIKGFLLAHQLGLLMILVSVNHLSHTIAYGICVIGMGLSGGLFTTVTGIVWPKLYGRAFLGTISGFNASWLVSASAVGPLLFAVSDQIWGSFEPASYLLLVVVLLQCLWSLKVAVPELPPEQQ